MQHLDCEMLPETFCYNNPWTKCCMRKCWRNCPSTQYYTRRCREIMQVFGNIMACSLIDTTVVFSHKTALTCSKQNHIKSYLAWAQLKKIFTKKIGNHHLLGCPIIVEGMGELRVYIRDIRQFTLSFTVYQKFYALYGWRFAVFCYGLVFCYRFGSSWWRHQIETFSALLALCAGNSPVPVNSPHKGQWRGALMFYLIYARINDWVNNREAGDLILHRGHYDVSVMSHGVPLVVWFVVFLNYFTGVQVIAW